jgi:Coenzyme PQQ synthesis protein D (PqqD)
MENVRVDTVPTTNLDARVRNFQGKLFVAGPTQVLELTETASFVWKQIDGRRSVRELAAALSSEYDVDVDTATDDVAELVDELVDVGVVTVKV